MRPNAFRAAVCAVGFMSAALGPLFSDESFGFDSPDETAAETIDVSPSQSVTVGGEVSAGFPVYTEMLDGATGIGDIETGDLFAGKLEFRAKGSNADAAINLELKPAGADASPVLVDEAYLRAFFGKLDVEAGLRKLTWGKADSMGPLDVLNPLDLTDLTVTDSLERKIASPLVHATLGLGPFARLEAVFIPSFEGHRFTTEGRWAPAQVTELPVRIINSVNQDPAIIAAVAANLAKVEMTDLFPDTSALEYSQAGIRFTATAGSSDFGFQYFYGNLQRPAISVTGFEGLPPAIKIKIAYNRYHQFGVDYASVLGGFNVRLEGAANITEDLEGDDGSVYNPALLWSAGFDRILAANVNLNLQGSGSVRLMDDKVADTIADTEAGTDGVQTKITAQLSRMFFRDSLDIKAGAVYDFGNGDWLLLPSVVWTKGDIEAETAAGFFGGDAGGELGQYGDNDYLAFSVKYRF